MRKIGVSIFIVFTFFAALSSSAQAQDFNHNLFWFRLILADKISDRIRWELYLQSRTQNGIENKLNTFKANHMRSIWLWFNYKLTDQIKLGVSPLGLFQSSLYISKPSEQELRPVNEYRFSIRLEQENKYNHFSYLNRIGLESRWRDLYNDGKLLQNFRFRYMARVDVPFRNKSTQNTLFTLSAYNETMFQAGPAVKSFPNVFDQNRSYLGIGSNITKNIKWSMGYLLLVQQRLNGKDFDKGNCLWLILTFDNLFKNFRKK